MNHFFPSYKSNKISIVEKLEKVFSTSVALLLTLKVLSACFAVQIHKPMYLNIYTFILYIQWKVNNPTFMGNKRAGRL